MPIVLARRALLASALACAAPLAAMAQAATPIKFQLDWRFEGPAALFLGSAAKGHYKAAGLDVTIDAGNGSVTTVQLVGASLIAHALIFRTSDVASSSPSFSFAPGASGADVGMTFGGRFH